MNYRVIITDGAFADVEKFLDYLEFNQGNPLTAERWLRKALAVVDTLRTMPHRCPKPPENDLREYTIRALRVDSHLFLYRVDDDRHFVEVFGFRHGAQMPQKYKLPE